jgi:hypothetical protein
MIATIVHVFSTYCVICRALSMCKMEVRKNVNFEW